MWSNFHTHTRYCDGKGEVVDYLEACRREGVKYIGFTSHAPLPFPCRWSMDRRDFSSYLDDIRSARKTYADLEVYAGLEVDYIPGVVSAEDFARELDFTVGSIHFVGSFDSQYWEIDNTFEIFRQGLQRVFSNDIREAVSSYFTLTREMVREGAPDIVGHLDKIKINALRFFNEEEKWYREEVDKTLKVIGDAGLIVEVNTRGLYKKKSESTYPSPWILERMRNLHIPITLNSDAHHPEDLTREFRPTYNLLTGLGFKEITILKNGRWTPIPLNEYGKN